MQVSHRFAAGSAVFDEQNLVSLAGLVPVMGLAQQTGLVEALAKKVAIAAPRIKSGSVNPGPKLATLVAGMAAGADSIDDVDVLRSGGMSTVFDRVYAPSTVGTLLREFTFGHARQLEAVLREHLARLCQKADLLAGSHERVFVDIDSLLRPVYGHKKQGASYGHTKIAGKQILRKGLSPLATTISTDHAAPVIAGMRLRAGRTWSGKGAGRMVAQAIATARAAGVTGEILVRGDSAYGTRAVVGAARRAGVRFSLVLTKNAAVARAIATIPEAAWTPVNYPGAVRDPDTGEWISQAQVAEIPYTAFASTPEAVTARLIVRRVRDAARQDELFPVWRYHPFFTDSTEPAVEADLVHRRHAIIETVFADLIDGPLAHMPSGRFGANSPLGTMRGDHAQPAPRRRRTGQPPAGQSPLSHPAAHHHRCSRPSGSSATQTRTTPTHPLALDYRLATTLARHHPGHLNYLYHPYEQEQQWKSWADQRLPHTQTPSQHTENAQTTTNHQPVDPG